MWKSWSFFWKYWAGPEPEYNRPRSAFFHVSADKECIQWLCLDFQTRSVR
jgi:hypothetical protein